MLCFMVVSSAVSGISLVYTTTFCRRWRPIPVPVLNECHLIWNARPFLGCNKLDV